MSRWKRCAEALWRAWRLAVESARLAVGVPDYERYLAHRRQAHPDQPVMSRAEFHAERMRARYGRGRSRCC